MWSRVPILTCRRMCRRARRQMERMRQPEAAMFHRPRQSRKPLLRKAAQQRALGQQMKRALVLLVQEARVPLMQEVQVPEPQLRQAQKVPVQQRQKTLLQPERRVKQLPRQPEAPGRSAKP